MSLKKKRALVAGRTNEERSRDAAKRKEIFLSAYEEWGTVKKACEVAGISRMSYRNWEKADPEFVKHFDLMKQSFAESLEEIALQRVQNPDKNRGSDVLLLGLLNANMPQKYRPQVAINEDSAKELISEWRKASQVVKREGSEEEEKLPVGVEKVLEEILEKRGNASEKGKEPEDGQPEHQDT
jgi:hypothetical protein